MKLKNKIIIVGIITALLFVAFLVVMIKMINENGKCMDNPFVYSADKLEKSGGTYSCYCDSLDPGLLDFSFDKNGIRIIERMTMNNINWEDIEFIDKAG